MNKIDEIKAEYQMAEELFKRQPQMRDKFNQTHDWIGYLLAEIERKDEATRKAINIWETATPEDDFDDIMHAVIDELKDSVAL